MDKDEIKRRRRELLAGKTVTDLLKERQQQIYYVYYTDSGTIVEVTPEAEAYPDLAFMTLTEYQLGRHADFAPNTYMVTVKKGIATLERKPDAREYVSAERQFLHEITAVPDADVIVTTTGNTVNIKLKSTAQDRAKRLVVPALKFYLTKPHDPHIMYETLTVNMNSLISGYSTTVNINTDYSVYTMTVFDTYTRITE